MLGGDGRADTPGHCVKYGTYTVMDLDFMMVVDVQLKQSNQVGGSAHMEKAGLLNSIKFFTSQNLDIGELVTDRHPMIIKHVWENMKDVKHSIDVWHAAKGYVYRLMKQVISLAQKQTLAERLALLKQQPQLDEEEEKETDEDDIPPPIRSSYQKPDKAEAVDHLLSQYNILRAVNMDSCD